MNALIACMILPMLDQAACSAWMISITAAAAGTISETSFSIRTQMTICGIAALIPSHTKVPTWARVIPPRLRRLQTPVPSPTID